MGGEGVTSMVGYFLSYKDIKILIGECPGTKTVKTGNVDFLPQKGW